MEFLAQLFIYDGAKTQEFPLSNRTHWEVDVITLAFSWEGLQAPMPLYEDHFLLVGMI